MTCEYREISEAELLQLRKIGKKGGNSHYKIRESVRFATKKAFMEWMEQNPECKELFYKQSLDS